MIQQPGAAAASQDGMVMSAMKVSLKSILTVSTLGLKSSHTPPIHLVHFFQVTVANLLKSMFANYCLELTKKSLRVISE